MSIPKLVTQTEHIQSEYEKNPQRTLMLALLQDLGASTSYGKFPTYADQGEVARKSAEEFKRNDFSSAYDYIDSLVQIADHYQSLAEEYHSVLARYGATFDAYGAELNPFVVTRNGRYVVGNADCFDIQEEWEDAADFLRKWLPSVVDEAKREKVAELIIEAEYYGQEEK